MYPLHIVLRACLIAASLAPLSQPANASGTEPPKEPLSAVFMRTMVVVSDLERSKAFYTECFGLRVAQESELDDALTKAQLGIPESRRARFALLVSDGVIAGRRRASASIGLLQLDAPPSAPLQRPAGEVLAAGEHVMALRTNDIATVDGCLQRRGARYAVQPVTTADGTATELVVHDPDGVRIHVVQRPDNGRDF